MSSCLSKTGALSVVLTVAVCCDAPLRKWTNTEGRSFSGRIVDCDGETAKYKVFGRNKLVEIPLSQLCPADRRSADAYCGETQYEGYFFKFCSLSPIGFRRLHFDVNTPNNYKSAGLFRKANPIVPKPAQVVAAE